MKSSIDNFLKRHAFTAFIILTLLISWFPWYTTGSGFFVFGPSIAGVVIIALTQGKDGMRNLGQRALRWRVGWGWWLVALFISGVIILAALPLNALFGGNMPTFAMFRQEWYLIPAYFLLTLLGGPLGEEFGWRGFALPHLQRKWNPVLAGAFIGLLWGLWHLPLFFQPGSAHAMLGLNLLPVFVIGEMGLSIIMTWVYNNTGGSLLVGGIILHNADNFWTSTLFVNETMTSAFRGGAQSDLNMSLYLAATVTGVLAAVIVAFVSKWRLGLSKE